MGLNWFDRKDTALCDISLYFVGFGIFILHFKMHIIITIKKRRTIKKKKIVVRRFKEKIQYCFISLLSGLSGESVPRIVSLFFLSVFFSVSMVTRGIPVFNVTMQ